jgi:O-antigen/teichoic acid export membrane protein
MLGLAVLLIPRWGAMGAAVAYATPRAIAFVGYTAGCHALLHLPMPLRSLARIVAASAFMGLAIYLGLLVGAPWLLVAIGVAPVAYIAALVALGELGRDDWRVLRQMRGYWGSYVA